MQQKELARRVTELCAPIAEELCVDIWDVTFEKEGPRYTLTVIIDRESGIDIEDCEKISRTLDPLLDAPVFDSLPTYTLCVSSAGLERVLRTAEHYNWALGKQVEITFYKPHDGEKSRVGELREATDKEITVGENTYTMAEIALCRLYYDFTSIKDI